MASTGAERLGGVASRGSVVGRTVAVHAGIRGVSDVAVVGAVVGGLVGLGGGIVVVGVITRLLVSDRVLDFVNDARHFGLVDV